MIFSHQDIVVYGDDGGGGGGGVMCVYVFVCERLHGCLSMRVLY